MKESSSFINEIERLLSEYLKEIAASDLKPLTAKVYRTSSVNFVRWIKGEFKPGKPHKK